MTDQEIQANVLDEFKWDPRINPTEIGVTVRNGVVTLAGSVESYTQKWTAEEIALRVSSVKAAVNNLEVRLSAENERTEPGRTRLHAPVPPAQRRIASPSFGSTPSVVIPHDPATQAAE